MDRGVHACLRCGTVTASELLTRHIHHNTFEPYDRREIPLTDAARSWLSAWPRLIRSDRGGPFCLPASTQIQSGRELFDRAAAARAEQHGWAPGRRLRAAGLPAGRPPSLPAPLEDFAYAWESSGFAPGDDARLLLRRADPRYRLSSPFAIDALLHRDDCVELVVREIREGDHYRRMTACAIAGEDATIRTAALPALLEWLTGVCLGPEAAQPGRLEESWHVAAVLDTVKRWRPAGEWVDTALASARERIGRRDFELVRKIDETLRVVKGEPPLPISTVPWFLQS